MVDNLREIIIDRINLNPQFFSGPIIEINHIIDVAISIINTRDGTGPKGGGFVHAVIDNDLELAVTKADHINIHALRFYVDINRHFHLDDEDSKQSILKSLYNKAEEIVASNESWKDKYDLIFSDEISKKVFELTNLDYYDPDMDYNDDVLAFMNAFENKINEL